MWYGPIAISDISCRISYLCIRVAAVAAAAGSLLPAASPQSICWSYRCSGIIINWVRRKRNRWEKEEEVHMFPRTSVQFAVISPGTAGRFLRLGEWVQWLSDMVTRDLPITCTSQDGTTEAEYFFAIQWCLVWWICYKSVVQNLELVFNRLVRPNTFELKKYLASVVPSSEEQVMGRFLSETLAKVGVHSRRSESE